VFIPRISSGGRDSRARRLLLAAALVATLSFAARPARAQEPAHEQPAAAAQGAESPHEAVAHESAEGEAHEESIWPFIGKIFNFAVLAGGLVYLLRKPFGEYLARRGTEVRAELAAAQTLKAEATAKIAEIEARMKALPAELEALGARGRADVAAEEQRIRDLAAAEQRRLLDQATREIDQRVRNARRELLEHAADLTIDVARTKIQREITDADRSRLVDQYLSQVTSHE
jgi:F-type H+-transporting ATPase subunit b